MQIEKKERLKDIFMVSFCLSLIVYLLIVVFYSFGKVDESELIIVETAIYNCEVQTVRTAWLTFFDDTGVGYYTESAQVDAYLYDLAKVLCDIEGGQMVQCAYTPRSDISPFRLAHLPLSYNHRRLVSLSVGDKPYLTLEDFNKGQTNGKVGYLIVTAFVVGWLVLMLKLLISSDYKRSKRRKKSNKGRTLSKKST